MHERCSLIQDPSVISFAAVDRCLLFEAPQERPARSVTPRLEFSPPLLRRQATQTLRSFHARECYMDSTAAQYRPDRIPPGLKQQWQDDVAKGIALIYEARLCIAQNNLERAVQNILHAEEIRARMNQESFAYQYQQSQRGQHVVRYWPTRGTALKPLTTPTVAEQNRGSRLWNNWVFPYWRKIGRTIRYAVRHLLHNGKKNVPLLPSVHSHPSPERKLLNRRAALTGITGAMTMTLSLMNGARSGEAASAEKPLDAALLIFPDPTKVYTLDGTFYSKPLHDGRHAVHIPQSMIAQQYHPFFRPGAPITLQAIRQNKEAPILVEQTIRLPKSGYLPIRTPDNRDGRYQPACVDLELTDQSRHGIYDAAIWFDESENPVYTDFQGRVRLIGHNWRDTTTPTRAHVEIVYPDGEKREVLLRVHGGTQKDRVKLLLGKQAEDVVISKARYELQKRLSAIRGMDQIRVRGALNLFNRYGANGSALSMYLIQIAEEFARLDYPQPSTEEVQAILGHFLSVASAREEENGVMLRNVIHAFIAETIRRQTIPSVFSYVYT